ncbi:MAG: LacI family DNA-binding transcriptional regulator [Candidatus Borkfalkiaceae bacterium]|nr:LacI family DNA-binding transcriptional regulator [Christensenellaceae bacterium]
MKSTIRDIAEACGVSVSLVSRIMNGDKTLKCRQETRERVLKEIEDRLYVPDHHARMLAQSNLVTHRNLRVGYISYKGAGKTPNPYFDNIIAGITTILTMEEYEVKRFYIDEVSELCRKNVPLSDKRFDGLILFGDVPGHLVDYLYSQTRYLSSVYGSEIPSADFVGTNIVETMNTAADYARKLGFTRTGILSGGDEKRERALLQHMEEIGMEVDERYFLRAGNEYNLAYKTIAEKVRTETPPELLCCMNDEMAIGAMDALLDAGFRVPEDVSVIGHDDIARSAYCRVPLTTVRIYKEEIGRLVSDLLLERINYKRKFAVKTFIPCELVVRKSVRRKTKQEKSTT